MLIAVGLWLLSGVVSQADERAGGEFFESKIRPVLVKQCYACHSAEAAKTGKLKGGLQLDTRKGVLKGGESGAVIVAGKPAESLLIRSLRHAADAPEMPPNERLPDAVIADFEEWVRIGAPDSRDGDVIAVKRGMSIEDGRRWWSMIPPKRVEPPTVKKSDWPRGNVDRFVLAKLEEREMTPVEDADQATLVRRVYFDLIGLPPAPDKVEAFLNDSSGKAFANVVDELLASPRFGERWGRHWLDAARYADSNGRDRNVMWYHAWRYRDYVINAFNADKRFDQFVREQIAGDLIAANARPETEGGDPKREGEAPAEPRQSLDLNRSGGSAGASPSRPLVTLTAADLPTTDELRIATGFLALGPKAFEEQKPEIFRMDVIDEQIEVIGRSILGLSVGCARCHDHKFDPIPTRDYYALAGILRSTQPLYGHGPRGIKATSHHHTELIAVGPDAASLGSSGLAYFEKLQELNLTQNTLRSQRYGVVRRVADAKNQLQKPGADTAKIQSDIDRMDAEIKEFDAKVKAAEEAFQKAMDQQPQQPGWAMGARDRDKVEDCRVHIRGETTNLGDVVPRGSLQVVSHQIAAMPATSSGRLELANWLTSRDNPLTARVFVNRVWLHLFGKGLVTTPDDFGVNGSPPSHPELLDDLAVRFMEQGWSIKTLIRELVLSRTYQLASVPDATSLKSDPDNVWLWRASPRRLDVEPFRDAILSVSGQLDERPPSQEQTFLAKFQPHRNAEFFNFNPPFKPTEIEHSHRSVYLPIVRGVLPTMFQLFDFAAPDRPVAQRDESTVPSQALFLMNNAWIGHQSEHAARRLLAEPNLDDEGRVQRLFRLAFARSASEEEVRTSLDYLSSKVTPLDDGDVKKLTASEDRRNARWRNLCQAIFASAEFRTLK